MDILYVWTDRRSTMFCNEMLSSELTAIENHHEVEVHLLTICVFYIISEVDIMGPWEYLHAGVAAARLTPSVNCFFKQHKNV